MAVDTNAQAVLAEHSWDNYVGEFPYYFLSSEGTGATIEMVSDGVAINNPRIQDDIWKPQTVVLDDCLTLKEGLDYVVRLTLKAPSYGTYTYQVQMGNWETYDQYEVPLSATGDWQIVDIKFPNFCGDIGGNGHVVFQNGWAVGTTIIKKVQVLVPQKRTIHVTTAGTLSNYISDEEKYQIEELTLTGEINGDDLGFLREMAGATRIRSYWRDPTTTDGLLSVLDISNVKIVAGGLYYADETSTSPFDNLYYNLDDNNIIPKSVFCGCGSLSSIILPNNITSIGMFSFAGCSSLTSVIIPSSVTSIDYCAFQNCSCLTIIESDISNLFSISDVFYSNIYSTATLIVPKGKKSAYQATDGWNNFTNIVESIVGGQFEMDGVRYLISGFNTVSIIGPKDYVGDLYIPSQVIYNGLTYNVTYIKDSAFENCKSITSVTIPNSVTSIGGDAFYGCSNLSTVNYGNRVSSIGETAFSGTAWYNNKPDGLVYAGKVAYRYKGEMPDNTSVVIDEGTLGIAAIAFYRCSGLTSITIPNSVISIGGCAFMDCPNLTTIISKIENPNKLDQNVFNSNNNNIYSTATLIVPTGKKSVYQATEGWKEFTNIVEVDGVGYIFESNGIYCKIGENSTVSIVSGQTKYSGNIEIPSQVTFNGKIFSVTGIEWPAFYNCSNLITVKLPSSLISFGGEDAFSGCSNLVSINIPNGVTRIPPCTFEKCGSLTSITIPNGVTSIYGDTFLKCYGLKSVTLGRNVNNIAGWAFGGCIGLRTIISLNRVPPSCIENTSYNSVDKEKCVVWVPKGSLAAYKSAIEWKDFKIIKEIPIGDVNLDGKVNNDDLDALVSYIMGQNPIGFYEGLADLNGDERVDAADVVTLIKGCNLPVGVVAVDLDLPSGTLWANMNVGARRPEDYGYSFAWGETTPKIYYYWSSYKWCNGSIDTMTKYCNDSNCGYNGFTDGRTVLEASDDAATANWGIGWCMPTKEQWDELIENTTSLWITESGVSGIRFMSKTNGNSIFLPSAGWSSGNTLDNEGWAYWSSTLCESNPNSAWNREPDKYFLGYRCIGRSVRPVRASVY